jgi:hypothetical protein
MGIHENTDDMTGNIVLYKSTGYPLLDKLIQTTTRGPYVHADIVVAPDRTTVGATLKGIGYSRVPNDPTTYCMISLLAYDPYHNQQAWEKSLMKATAWAKSKVGTAYGWLDIVDQGLDFLIPGNKIHIVDDEHWDCSDFVCRYLYVLGLPLPPKMLLPAAISPNDLARFFGALKS